MNSRILLVDDDRDYLYILRGKLAASGFKSIRTEDDPKRAAALFDSGERFDLALIDMGMPVMDGLSLLEVIKNKSPRTECIMATAVDEARVAVACIKKGAYDYLVKPISQEDLTFSVLRALERKRFLDLLHLGKSNTLPELTHKKAFAAILTRSPQVIRVLKEAELHAASNVPMLVTGESGTGKELLARAIHGASPRNKTPFTPVNMASLTGSLFEAEFFGHTKGAFTGAERERAGHLRHTDGGTLFLDEIGNLPIELQGKLLRVLQDGEFTRLGSSTSETVDIRFIAATNENLEALMDRNQFRKDLYYRIGGGRLHLPPLRERREDIPLLADHFLKEYCVGDGCEIEDEVMCLLMEYPFPGNVRELRSIIQSAANLAQGRPLTADRLPRELRKRKAVAVCNPIIETDVLLTMADVEKAHILKTYHRLEKNKSRTARQLGIGLNTLRRKLRSYGES